MFGKVFASRVAQDGLPDLLALSQHCGVVQEARPTWVHNLLFQLVVLFSR